jgi:glucose-1-phosphate cytidylyltransferase
LARFGALHLAGDLVDRFEEKPVEESGLISGGFFILSPKVLDFIEGDETLWERGPMERLAAAGELMAYRHGGFWQPMDTLRDKNLLEQLCESGAAPWMTWQG